MKVVFGDSAFFIAFLSREDAYHERAVSLASDSNWKILTTRWVLLEVGNFLHKKTHRGRFIAFNKQIPASSTIRIIGAEAREFEDGFQLYSERPDKDWSMTDCISFAVMKRYGLRDALTTDHHFVQAGFNALLVQE